MSGLTYSEPSCGEYQQAQRKHERRRGVLHASAHHTDLALDRDWARERGLRRGGLDAIKRFRKKAAHAVDQEKPSIENGS